MGRIQAFSACLSDKKNNLIFCWTLESQKAIV